MTAEEQIRMELADVRGQIAALKVRAKQLSRQLSEIVAERQRLQHLEAQAELEQREAFGAGTELHTLLSRIGITPQPGCKCKDRMRLMNRHGTQWCRDNLTEIVEWLHEEAERQELPWGITQQLGATAIVKFAIRRAERKERHGQRVLQHS